MLESIWNTVLSVFGSGDLVTRVVMLVIVLIVGLRLQAVGNIINATFSALVVFGLARLAILVSQGVPAGDLPGRAWADLGEMRVSELAVYFLAFAIVILIIRQIRVLARRD
ncbi:MAG TPA: hypothetical protein DCL54_15950 [Alphaproteobacteria bacterium]|nr:hypothetical protein [Alphaproteobacteria bacterium]HAJ48066.1 hypothetical protein [Alphaproteobacteria bacterium]